MTKDSRRAAVVVEDDTDIKDLVKTILEKIGLNVYTATTAAEGLELAREHDPLVVTLDINLPGMDGFEAARRMREFTSAYIVVISARDEEIDTLQGLAAGADDYLTKPFRARELRARIEAMLRRPRTLVSGLAEALGDLPAVSNSTTDSSTGPILNPPAAAVESDPRSNADVWLHHNGLRLNPARRLVELDDNDVPLTQSEFDILQAMLESGRLVRRKEDLIRILHSKRPAGAAVDPEADKRGVEVHMSNLRRKLGDAPSRPRIIETVRGVGYRLTANQQG